MEELEESKKEKPHSEMRMVIGAFVIVLVSLLVLGLVIAFLLHGVSTTSP